MYKVLIIEEDAVCRERLKKHIDWKQYRFEICAEVKEGENGLLKLNEYNPELVILDVDLTGISGIEVIKRARENGFTNEFLILSHSLEFEKAREAINLGVKGYLLKPIKKEEVHSKLREIENQLDRNRKRDRFILDSVKKAKTEVLRNLLFDPEYSKTCEKELSRYQIKFTASNYCVCIIKSNHIKEVVCRLDDEDIVVDEDKAILIFSGYTYEEASGSIRRLKEKLEINNEKSVFFTFGQTVRSWRDLAYSYKCAKMLLEYEFLFKTEGVLTIRSLEEKKSMVQESIVEYMQNMIELGDKEGIHDVVEEFLINCKRGLEKEYKIKQDMVKSVMLLFSSLQKRYEKKSNGFPSLEQVTVRIMQARSIEELMEEVVRFANELCNAIGAIYTENVVKRMYLYMQCNFDKELKLENIARMFNYNSAYLGKIFKKEFGESFNITLDRIRIQNAKELLASGNMKVYEISEKVGFCNIDYFCTKFKKYVGVSPKKYKKLGYRRVESLMEEKKEDTTWST